MNPKINYRETFEAIREDKSTPLEIFRELISNSYDALHEKGEIHIFCFGDCFVYFDTGVGLSDENLGSEDSSEEDIVQNSWHRFWCIGYSEKREDQIGSFCRGTKLVLACTTGAFILGSKSEGSDVVLCKSVSNPAENLCAESDVSPTRSSVDEWKKFLKKKLERNGSLSKDNIEFLLKQCGSFQSKSFTCIVCCKVTVASTLLKLSGSYKLPVTAPNPKLSAIQKSALLNYIQFKTRHGTFLNVIDKGSFPALSVLQLGLGEQERQQLRASAKLWLYRLSQSEPQSQEISFGFPYLQVADLKELRDEDYAENISRIDNYQGAARLCGHARINNEKDCQFIFALDGGHRAFKEYATLNRGNRRRCNLHFNEFRGIVFASKGVYVCADDSYLSTWLEGFRELPYNSSQVRISADILRSRNVRNSYLLVINGPFALRCDRNAVADKEKAFLNSAEFKSAFQAFFKRCLEERRNAFLSLVAAASLQLQERAAADERSQQNRRKERMCDDSETERFWFECDEGALPTTLAMVDSKLFFAPSNRGETQVIALYQLFALLGQSCAEEQFRQFWLRPLDCSNVGVDCICLADASVQKETELFKGRSADSRSLYQNLVAKSELTKAVEFKCVMPKKSFNHPLEAIQVVICWTFANGADVKDVIGTQLLDTTDSVWTYKQGEGALSEVGCILVKEGTAFAVKVISLRLLLEKSFLPYIKFTEDVNNYPAEDDDMSEGKGYIPSGVGNVVQPLRIPQFDYEVVRVPGNGNCFYSGLSYGLDVRGGDYDLREDIARFVERRADSLLEGLERIDPDFQLGNLINDIRTEFEWANEKCLHLACKVFDRNIVLAQRMAESGIWRFQLFSKDAELGYTGDTMVLADAVTPEYSIEEGAVWLYYNGVNHFDAVIIPSNTKDKEVDTKIVKSFGKAMKQRDKLLKCLHLSSDTAELRNSDIARVNIRKLGVVLRKLHEACDELIDLVPNVEEEAGDYINAVALLRDRPQKWKAAELEDLNFVWDNTRELCQWLGQNYTDYTGSAAHQRVDRENRSEIERKSKAKKRKADRQRSSSKSKKQRTRPPACQCGRGVKNVSCCTTLACTCVRNGVSCTGKCGCHSGTRQKKRGADCQNKSLIDSKKEGSRVVGEQSVHVDSTQQGKRKKRSSPPATSRKGEGSGGTRGKKKKRVSAADESN